MNPYDTHSIMLKATCRAKGVDPDAFYITTPQDKRKQIFDEATANLEEMVQEFVNKKYKLGVRKESVDK